MEYFSRAEARRASKAAIADKIVKEIVSRGSQFLNNVGLDYLSLDRSAETLSGGEAQRIRLASQIGSGLTGVMYVLDEPSIGLHQRDNDRLLATLKHLRDLGNSVIVVEHDHDAIMTADYVVDMGPGAGEHGGQVVAQGTPDEIRRAPHSLTGQYLAGPPADPDARAAASRPTRSAMLTITGASGNNLRDVTLQLPVGLFVCVTGVSGSGKSTLINDTLYHAVARHLYGSTDEPAPFTPNRRARAFRQGDQRRPEPDRPHAAVESGDVHGPVHADPRAVRAGEGSARARLRARALLVQRQGRPLRSVPGRRAHQGRDALPARRLRALRRLPRPALQPRDARDPLQGPEHPRSAVDDGRAGLRVLRAGAGRRAQAARRCSTSASATSRSANRRRRCRAARRSASSSRSSCRSATPAARCTSSTSRRPGLHFHDIELLLTVLHRLRDHGNTVVVIEHNLDVIKTADWIIDLGPEGGAGGGQIIAQGAPATIASVEASYTGRYLKPVLGSLSAAENGRIERRASIRAGRSRKASSDLIG